MNLSEVGRERTALQLLPLTLLLLLLLTFA